MEGLDPNSAAATALEFEPALHEQFGFVRLYADLAQGHIDASDFAGLAYAVRQLVARTRYVAGVLNDLGMAADSAREGR